MPRLFSTMDFLNMLGKRDDNAIKGYYGLSCPSGQFYICDGDETEFIGCCASNPCGSNKGICPQADLRASSFSGDNYDKLLAQNCSNDAGTQNWWTCKGTNPPFMGCCNINACGNDGCPVENLVPAKLSSHERNRASFLDPEGYGDVTPSPTASATPTATPTNSDSDDSGLGTGALVGISVGATLGALLVLGLLFWKCWWQPRKRKQGQPMTQVAPNEYQPHSPAGASFAQQSSPQTQYNRSFTSSPTTAYYPSGTPHDMQKYGWSPAQQSQQYDRPVSYGWTDASGMTPQMGNVPPGYTSNPQLVPQQQQIHSPQEMDASTTVVQELAGNDHHYHQSPHDHQQQAIQEQQRSPTYGHNQLGINRDN